MTKLKIQTTLSLSLFLGLSGLAAAQTAATPAARGERLYKVYCASCHGASGQGDGPVASDLKVPPTNLTRLSQHGKFPTGEVTAAIDGRRTVRGHGPGGMPVWGMSFQERGRDSDQEKQAREQIRDLVAYLESIQRK